MTSKTQARKTAIRSNRDEKLIDEFEAGKYWAFVFGPKDLKQDEGYGTNPIFVDKQSGDIVDLPMSEYLKYL